MPLEGNYEPGAWGWAAKQVDAIESSGGKDGHTLQGVSIFVLWTRGRKTRAVRKAPLIRVEHDGRFAAVASKGADRQIPVVLLEPAA